MKRYKASYTVEAAVVMPVYLCMAAVIMILFYAFMTSWGIQTALHQTAREEALYGAGDDETLYATAIALAKGRMLANGTPRGFVEGGVLGIHLETSEISERDISLTATYALSMPVGMFGIRNVRLMQHAQARRWIGYDPHEGESGDGYVFVTEYGTVYHTTSECRYLDLTIHAIGRGELATSRNVSGGRYDNCPLCKGSGEYVYVTDYGTAYHESLSCSGLKRTIYRITENEAIERGLGGCSKCGR